MTESGAPPGDTPEPVMSPGRSQIVLRNLYNLAAMVAFGGNLYLLLSWWHNPGRLFDSVARTYSFNTVHLPILFGATALASLVVCRRTALPRRYRRMAWTYFALALVLFAARVYATHIEPRLLQIRHAAFPSAKFARPLRILHISDIQSARVGGYEKTVFDKMTSLHPDLILFTGDLIQPVEPATFESELPKIGDLFAQLDPPLGAFGVLGDTDTIHYLENNPIAITWLHGNSRTIDEDGFPPIALHGLTLADSRFPGDPLKDRLRTWIDAAGPAAFTILLGHAPDFILGVDDLPIDLCLAGHTHGGQVRIPFYGAPVLQSNIPRQWGRGFHSVGQTRLNVSAGIGGEHIVNLPTIRFNCPPEMTLIEVSPEHFSN